VPDAREVAYADPRTAKQRDEYERLRRTVADDLVAADLDDLVPLLDGNLFGASLDPRLSDDAREGIERMLELGSPGAVFLVPPGLPLPTS
jgi:hypothetical protein